MGLFKKEKQIEKKIEPVTIKKEIQYTQWVLDLIPNACDMLNRATEVKIRTINELIRCSVEKGYSRIKAYFNCYDTEISKNEICFKMTDYLIAHYEKKGFKFELVDGYTNVYIISWG